jgi:hypothetical protein
MVSVVNQCTQDAAVRQSRISYLLVIIDGPSRRWVDLVVPTSSKRWRWKRWWCRDWPSGERRRGPDTRYVWPRHTLHVCSRSRKCQSKENNCHCHLKEALGAYLLSCHDVKVGRCKNCEHRECSWSPLNFWWHQKLSRAKKMWEWCTSESCPRVVDGERSSGCQEARKCDDCIKKMHQCHSKASQNYLMSKRVYWSSKCVSNERGVIVMSWCLLSVEGSSFRFQVMSVAVVVFRELETRDSDREWLWVQNEHTNHKMFCGARERENLLSDGAVGWWDDDNAEHPSMQPMCNQSGKEWRKRSC